jgi:tRNA threonylcarbamoyladenosine biosynthesis protein TsaB
LTLSLALTTGVGPQARAVEQLALGPPRKQSEMLPGEIEALLARHGVALSGLEGIVVGLGPGSFTGLRVGLATVKALAYAARLRVTGVSSLAAAALDGPHGRWAVIAEARRGELYVGRYDRAGESVAREAPETAMAPAELAQMLREEPSLNVLGPALSAYRAELTTLGLTATRLLDAGLVPSGVSLARLATLPATYDASALFALEPHYVRAAEAERNPKFPPLPGPAPAARIRGD